jgi:hypothetical protein
MTRFRSWLSETADRPSLADAFALAAGFFTLYLFTLMPGAGWGSGAALQLGAALGAEKAGGAISPLYTVPAGVFARLVPFGDFAWRVNLFGALLSVAALVVVYFTARLLVSNRMAAVAAAVALGFSPAFFHHAVAPNVMPLVLLLQAVALHELIRTRLLNSRVAFWIALVAAIFAGAVQPSASAGIFLAAFLADDRLLGRRGSLAAVVAILAVALAAVGFSQFGAAALGLLAVFLLVQFPFVGWILLGWGAGETDRRARGVLPLLIIAMLGSMPRVRGLAPEELFGAMLPALPPAALILAAGVDHVGTRLTRRREATDLVPTLLLASLVLCSLLTAGSVTYTLRASGFETRLALETPRWVDFRGNPWHDALLYAFWPPKNEEGSGVFLAEAEQVLPDECVLVVDPEILWALEYARAVEGRLKGVHAVAFEDTGTQVAALLRESGRGARIFLAGTEPEFYDVPGMASAGDLVPSGRFYEWRPFVP